jgi:hypothetical protein
MPYTKQYVHALRIAFTVICVVAAAAVGIGAWVVVHQSREIKADQRQIQRAQELIQEQRYEATYRICVNQNHRNTRTVAALQSIVDAIVKKHPKRAASLRQAVKENVLLINALMPVQSCRSIALKSVTKPPEVVPDLPPLS